MPNKAAIVRTFEINAERATYTNKFATLIEKLRALGLADERVPVLYSEVLKSRKGKLNTDFTKLIWGKDEFANIGSLQNWEKSESYGSVVRAMIGVRTCGKKNSPLIQNSARDVWFLPKNLS